MRRAAAPAAEGDVMSGGAEERTTPSLLARFRERLLAPRRARIERILTRGVSDGTLRADLDLDAATNLLVGSFYARYLASSEIPADWPDRIVDAVWPEGVPERSWPKRQNA
jgi:hypothetical protein